MKTQGEDSRLPAKEGDLEWIPPSHNPANTSSQTSILQNYEKTNFCHLSHPFVRADLAN